MTLTLADKVRVIDENLAAFMAVKNTLVDVYAGKHALMRDREVKGFFDTAIDAQSAGELAFSDGLFSIQEVAGQHSDLGYYSHAYHTRAP
jgi:hypothetical protein